MQARKEIFQISGDQSQGISAGVNFNNSALCHPVVFYQGQFLTLDVFTLPDTPMYVTVQCPLCEARHPGKKPPNDLTIKADQKDIELYPKRMPKFPGYINEEVARGLELQNVNELIGVFSVNEIGCVWEIDPKPKQGIELSQTITGENICPWNVVIKNNIAEDVPRRR